MLKRVDLDRDELATGADLKSVLDRPSYIIDIDARIHLHRHPFPRSFVLSVVGAVTSFVQTLVGNPQVSELFRFIFLGTIVKPGKTLGETIRKFAFSIFVVMRPMPFPRPKFSLFLPRYLPGKSRVRNTRLRVLLGAQLSGASPRVEQEQVVQGCRARCVVETECVLVAGESGRASRCLPDFVDFKSSGHIRGRAADGFVLLLEGKFDLSTKASAGNRTTTTAKSIWSRKRQILNDFVRAARQFYIDSKVLPRKVDREKEPSGAFMTPVFPRGDLAHDWMLAYLRSTTALEDTMDFTISTNQSDLGWGGAKDTVRYITAHDTPQRFLFTSPVNGRSTWLQGCCHSKPWPTSYIRTAAKDDGETVYEA
ncbi:hypothetical protein C8R44DRAFT_747457 [Mycena epipterygia]|nr:hypothetical protein C8R44DRAFT_747457 [Mycena epipterygia]